MTEEIIIDGVNIAGCEHLYGDNCCDDTKLSSIDCAKNNCRYKEYKHLQRENKEKINIIEQMIKILYPNTSDDELYDVAFNGEYIDKLKELKDTSDTMLMANDIKKQDIDSLREDNDRLEQENKELRRKAFLAEQNAQLSAAAFCEKDNKIIELEQENKELKEENIKVKKEFNNLIAEIISDIEYTGEITCNGESPKEHLHQMQKALASLNTIQRMVLSAWEQGKYLDGGLYNDLTKEFAKINEVL